MRTLQTTYSNDNKETQVLTKEGHREHCRRCKPRSELSEGAKEAINETKLTLLVLAAAVGLILLQAQLREQLAEHLCTTKAEAGERKCQCGV
jgi:hypothetical protein